jgi:hypothetical protein
MADYFGLMDLVSLKIEHYRDRTSCPWPRSRIRCRPRSTTDGCCSSTT